MPHAHPSQSSWCLPLPWNCPAPHSQSDSIDYLFNYSTSFPIKILCVLLPYHPFSLLLLCPFHKANTFMYDHTTSAPIYWPAFLMPSLKVTLLRKEIFGAHGITSHLWQKKTLPVSRMKICSLQKLASLEANERENSKYVLQLMRTTTV